jgi:hypothetical protein
MIMRRAMFALYLVMIVGGALYFIAIGLLHQ